MIFDFLPENAKFSLAMNIGVDIRPLHYYGTGNGNFLYHLLKETIRMAPEHWDWYLFTNKPIDKAYREIITSKNTRYVETGGLLSKTGPLWFHFLIPGILKKYNIRLFWSTLFLLPYRFKKRYSIPAIMNIHDFNAWIAPETMVLWKRLYLKFFTKNSLKNADMILCLSETTRSLLFRLYPQWKEQIQTEVVYPGIITPPEARIPPSTLLQGKRFFLAVGTLEPRKNFESLIDGYLLAKKEDPSLPYLVIAGKSGWKLSPTLEKLKNNAFREEGIIYVSSPKQEELFWLYENTLCFFYPSIYEGFGLQILEAAYFHKPQILSGIPIFLEIGKNFDGVFFVEEPKNPELWKEMILSVTDRMKILKINNERLGIFDYSKSAEKMIRILKSLT